jgi:hypothetical protein
LKDGWRAAAGAFRHAYGEPSFPGRGNANEAFEAATAALKEVVPDLSDHNAMLEAVAAVHYASVVASKWLYALYKPGSRNR